MTDDTTLSGANSAGDGVDAKADPEMTRKITELRAKVHETFGQAALTMMALPRYRHLSIAELSPVLLEPMIRDRIAVAKAESAEAGENFAGIAIWASVSEEVDAKIREQIKAGSFPVRLSPDEWRSGDIHWLLDIIAPSQRLGTSLLANMKQVIPEGGDLRIHPIISKLVEKNALEKMGATPNAQGVQS